MMSFWVVPWSCSWADALLLGGDDVERQQPRGGRVDRHRRVHLAERDAVHQRGHVAAVGDRDADLADLAARELVVGVIARLRGQVERHRQARLALFEVAPVELVGGLRRRVTRVRAHHPGPVTLGQPRGVLAAHAAIVRSRRGLYPDGHGPNAREATNGRAGSGLGGAWRVIVRNDDHNTFDHVARTLARFIPGSRSSAAWRSPT